MYFIQLVINILPNFQVANIINPRIIITTTKIINNSRKIPKFDLNYHHHDYSVPTAYRQIFHKSSLASYVRNENIKVPSTRITIGSFLMLRSSPFDPTSEII